jgi:long-chain acyl-CoA synthetase
LSSNLAHNLVAAARRHAGRTAIKQDRAELSYEALNIVTSRFAGFLRDRGVQPGDRVGIMLPNVVQFAVAYYGALRAGAVVVPMDVLSESRDVALQLSAAEARLLFAWHELAEVAEQGAADAGADCVIVRPRAFGQLLAESDAVRDVVHRADSDTAAILYASGTTGAPKAAKLTHANLRRNAEVAQRLFGLDETSVTLGTLPLHESFGQTCALNATIASGGLLTLLPRFDAGKALELIQRDGVTVFQGVTTMLNALLDHPARERFDASSIRICASGDAPLASELLRDFEHAFGCAVSEGYGPAETSPVASQNRSGRQRTPGSALPAEAAA